MRPDALKKDRYADLEDDLDAQMRRLAGCLGIPVPERKWPTLVHAARFPAMRQRAESLAPDRHGVFHSRAASSGLGALIAVERCCTNATSRRTARTGLQLTSEAHTLLRRPPT